MENSIVNTIKGIFQEDTIAALANSAGETTDQVKRGLDTLIPVVLLGLQHQSTSRLDSILEEAKLTFSNFPTRDRDRLPFAEEQQTATAKPTLIEKIFDDDLSTVSESLNSYLGLPLETIQTLLSASLPAVFSVITQGGQNWDTTQIKGLLDQHKEEFLSAAPAGLTPLTVDTKLDPAAHAAVPPVTIADAIVDPTHTSPAQPLHDPAVHTPEVFKQQRKGARIWWLLALVIIVALWVLFGKGCNGQSEANQPANDTEIR